MSVEQIFEGQTVLITGAAGGFGKSASALFAERGANLVLSDYNADGLAALAASLEKDGHKVTTLAGSVAEEDHCRETVELAMERFGRLDVAINNAGIGHDAAKTAQIDSKQAHMTVQVDLMGVFYGMKYQIREMEKAHGQDGRICSILNVASLAGLSGAPTLGMYAAAKFGVVGLTKSAAIEYARRGIRINAICPAFARTPMVEDGLLAAGGGTKEAEDFLTRGIPMRRLAEPEEITRSMLWICDPRNTFMTGQAVALDGGTSAQ
ncbi:SDR family NAD(P)-dependent oxidoreductase [Pseudahrensia aquimaris]|uniref:SDR family NAD(P)-dependent oxidoreductase n=1 Tax=Pseudahrensia aquimaris TaxID=744461 RepID=A0ABW3FD47_9HYPH